VILDADGITLNVSPDHKFGSDSVLLANFINVRRKDIIYDLCTGSGIIPALLAKKRPKIIYAVDISREAITLLEKSVNDNNLDFVIPICADLRTMSPINAADLVTVNPPYFKQGTGKTRNSPEQAAARHEISCNLSDIAAAAGRLLKYGGYLKMCHKPERLADVICTLREHNLEPKEITFIVNKGKQTPRLFLLSAKKGGKAGCGVTIDN